ncbi:hypothetical protein PN466_10010 [Roseofilum reptotaenium CS-1145]|uniref:Novel STAND NTPase 1 domain-containing protein n=1 Tax=Roseofilum reptotaenium AO1-A TaxID=1925591 RepID=A0A1L9QJL9_9CYAN|nr:AAA family ATPase [Roseofilum reptotaenium]MDB9517280.1 hypothetical protein [Roseofilum reptotaenium CS-1145]OJJ14386.1 hypothetical protein BI308_25050 [Roseofilum reptotaenium AO1-A]
MTISQGTPEAFKNNQKSIEELAWEIEASQGKFTLILAHCNYQSLQEVVVQQLHQRSSVPIRDLKIEPETTQLFAVLKEKVLADPPLAVMVFGLELTENPEKLLAGMNQIREEFQKNCLFPMIVWVNDSLVKQFIRLAPDFESWATYTVFTIADSSELLDQLNLRIERLFNQVVEAGGDVFLSNEEIFGPYYRGELKSALNYVRHHQLNLPEEIEAGLNFAQGRDAYVKSQIDEAIALHQKSLQFWQHHDRPICAGAVLFHLGLCHGRQADLHRVQRQHYWQEARLSFQHCIKKFEEGQRLDLIAKFIGQLGEILWRLGEWEDLRQVVDRSLKLHQRKQTPIQEARDRSLLAALKLQEGLASEAQSLAQNALEILDRAPEDKPFYEGLPLLLLGRSFRALGEMQPAIATLERMKASNPEPDPQLYLEGLEELRSIYWQEQQYLEAFNTKQFQRSVEQQFRFIAFVGPGRVQPQRHIRPLLRPRGHDQPMAQEITASGREPDIKALLKRVRDTQHKLIVIHGESGVGKSSLIQAGLLPALEGRISGYRDILTVYLDKYNNCNQAFAQVFTGFAQALSKHAIQLPHVPNSAEELIAQLAANDRRNLLTILIFDQFEEFFFGCPEIGQQAEFLQFLGHALNVPYVKVILSLRADYIHKLLICNDIEDFAAIGNDTLSKHSLYGLGNFSQETAQQVIENLTEYSQFKLPEPLITEIVNELTNDIGQVRPIELQIVGAQLQNDQITTLAQYQQVSKDHLVQKHLQDVIEDCGQGNQQMAEFVLYLLTDDKNTRPLKLRTELEASLKETQPNWTEKDDRQLTLVLEILSLSGLVLLVPADPQRYQLVHDYLVPYIRKRETLRTRNKIKKIEEERELVKARLNRFIRRAFPISIAAIIVLMVTTVGSLFSLRQALNREIEGISVASISLLNSNEDLEAMIQGIKGWKKIQSNLFYKFFISPGIKRKMESAFLKVNYGIKETNRIAGHESWISDLSFSPDGQMLVTASQDGVVQLSTVDNSTIKEYNSNLSHEEDIYAVAFSKDRIVTGGSNGVIKTWSSTGEFIQSISSSSPDYEDATIRALAFHPQGNTFASGNNKGMIQLWNTDGTLLKSFRASEETIRDITFSPNGNLIASASRDGDFGEIKIWKKDGTFVRKLNKKNTHKKEVLSLAFSPDGKKIASGSRDRLIKIWTIDGTMEREMRGHDSSIWCLSFSPDGKILASGSSDSTVKLWQVADGSILRTVPVENTVIYGLQFRPKLEDKPTNTLTLAIGSGNNQVKFWQLNTLWREMFLLEHKGIVETVNFSNDQKSIITGSRNGIMKRFTFEGDFIQEIVNNENTAFYQISVSYDGLNIAAATYKKTVDIVDNLGNVLSTLDGHTKPIPTVEFSPKEEIVVTGSDDQSIKIWSINGDLIQDIPNAHKAEINIISFHPNGQIIGSGGEDNQAKLWDLNGNLLITLEDHRSSVIGMDFHLNQDLIATSSTDHTVKLWKSDGTLIATLDKTKQGHTNWVNRVKFSPDGTLLASASDDSTIKLWNVKDPEKTYLVTTLSLHTNWVRDIDFSRDGQYLVSASADQTVVRWNLEPINNTDLLLRQGCDWIRDYLTVSDEDRTICDGIEPLPSEIASPTPVATLNVPTPEISERPEPTPPSFVSQSTPSPVVSPSPEPDRWYLAVQQAEKAAQLAQVKSDPSQVVQAWQEAIALMQAVPEEHPAYTTAQQKIQEYQQNLSYWQAQE